MLLLLASVSRGTMKSAPWFQFLVRLPHLLWLYNPILERQTLLQLLQTRSVPGSAAAGASLCRLCSPSPSPPSTARSLSLPLDALHACLDGSSPAAAICSNGLPACQVDVTSLKATLTNPFCLRKLSKQQCPSETTRYKCFPRGQQFLLFTTDI